MDMLLHNVGVPLWAVCLVGLILAVLAVLRYAVNLCEQTRVHPLVEMGVSPRGIAAADLHPQFHDRRGAAQNPGPAFVGQGRGLCAEVGAGKLRRAGHYLREGLGSGPSETVFPGPAAL